MKKPYPKPSLSKAGTLSAKPLANVELLNGQNCHQAQSGRA
jgi:hypothetical protein